jgi:hypothetical protein
MEDNKTKCVLDGKKYITSSPCNQEKYIDPKNTIKMFR